MLIVAVVCLEVDEGVERAELVCVGGELRASERLVREDWV